MADIDKSITRFRHELIAPVSLRIQNTQASSEFPARYFSIDPREEDITLRHRYVKKFAEAVGSKVQVRYDPELLHEEVMVMLDREAQNVNFALHEFVVPFYKPHVSQANARALNEVLPEYRQMRLDAIDMKWELLELISSWAIKSRLSREDFTYLYSLMQLDEKERDDYLTWLTTDSMPYPKNNKWNTKNKALKDIINESIKRYKDIPINIRMPNDLNVLPARDIKTQRFTKKGVNGVISIPEKPGRVFSLGNF